MKTSDEIKTLAGEKEATRKEIFARTHARAKIIDAGVCPDCGGSLYHESIGGWRAWFYREKDKNRRRCLDCKQVHHDDFFYGYDD